MIQTKSEFSRFDYSCKPIRAMRHEDEAEALQFSREGRYFAESISYPNGVVQLRYLRGSEMLDVAPECMVRNEFPMILGYTAIAYSVRRGKIPRHGNYDI